MSCGADIAPSYTAEITNNFIAFSENEEIRPSPYSPNLARSGFQKLEII